MGNRESVLVVDDEEIVRVSIEACLTPAYGVWSASDGATAVRMLSQFPFEHIVLDCVLPDLTPLEVLAEARRMSPSIDVLLISGQEEPALLAEAFRAGARAFLPKPFGPAQLRAALQRPVRKGPASLELAADMLLAEGYPLARALTLMRLEMKDRALSWTGRGLFPE